MSTITVQIDELSQTFTVSAVYTQAAAEVVDKCVLSVNYFRSASDYSSTSQATYTDTDTTPYVDGSDSTFNFSFDYSDFTPAFDELIEDGVYSFTAVFSESDTTLDTTNVETFNDYEVRLKIVQDSLDLGDKLESDNVSKRDYYKNEVLQALLKAANYAASSAIVGKALNLLDYIRKVTKYW